MTRKKRTIIFLIFLGIFTAAFTIGSEMEVSSEEAMAFVEEFQKTIEGIDAIGIFLHNSQVGLPMFIPGFGVAWGIFASWSTGFAFSALTLSYPELENIPALTILFLTPFGIMEVVAYSLGMSRSFLLIHTIIKKFPIKPQLRPTVIEIGIALALLFVGGFIEYAMIEQFGGNIELPNPEGGIT
jgi:hypothetical protein